MSGDILKTAVKRVTKEWAPIYAARDDAEHMIKSLLLGVEADIRWRMGQMSYPQSYAVPDGADAKAFHTGRNCAANIPDSILRRVDRS